MHTFLCSVATKSLAQAKLDKHLRQLAPTSPSNGHHAYLIYVVKKKFHLFNYYVYLAFSFLFFFSSAVHNEDYQPCKKSSVGTIILPGVPAKFLQIISLSSIS